MTLDTYHFSVRLGGNLSLDFINTVEYRDSQQCLDVLASYTHLLAWCWHGELISSEQAERLAARASRQMIEAALAFRAAVDLRETLYRIFAAVIDGDPPPSADLENLNTVLAASPRRVMMTDQGFAWGWPLSDDLTSPLWPIALAAGDLLASDQLARVRQCPNCGWLFVDTSRNHSRRWCSMDICGSQVKSRRQYERRKQQA